MFNLDLPDLYRPARRADEDLQMSIEDPSWSASVTSSSGAPANKAHDPYRPRPYPRPDNKKPNFFQVYGAYRPNSIFGFAAKRREMEDQVANEQYRADVAAWNQEQDLHNTQVRENHNWAMEDHARKQEEAAAASLKSIEAQREEPKYQMAPYTLPSGETIMLQHDISGRVMGFRDAQGNEYNMPPGTVPYQKPDQNVTGKDMWHRAFVEANHREPRMDEVDAHDAKMAAAGRAPAQPAAAQPFFDPATKKWVGFDPKTHKTFPIDLPAGATRPPSAAKTPAPVTRMTNEEVQRKAMQLDLDLHKNNRENLTEQQIQDRVNQFKANNSRMPARTGAAAVAPAATYKSAEEVRSAFKSGAITREQAKAELTKFGMQ